jgi:hypothetical protein
MASDVGEATAPTAAEAEAREARRRRGEAERGLWRRVSFRRAVAEGTIIFALWRLLVLVPLGVWPAGIFPLILLGLLVLRFLPPVWASMRLIATRREKMSRRFFKLAGVLGTTCLVTDSVLALAVGDPAQPFGGPTYGPDLPRFFAAHHHLAFGVFVGAEIATYGLLLAYYLIATICTRLAQGGFLRFTMPAGNGRVTL